MPSNAVFKVLNAVHHGLLKVSGGRIGWKASGMLVVDLTTTGRKTGDRHTVLLTSPVQDGTTVVLVASRWGNDHHPAWYLNLVAQPDVEAVVGGAPRAPMRARVATPEERATLWPRAVAVHKGYAEYQTKTTREIPLVLLEPRPS